MAAVNSFSADVSDVVRNVSLETLYGSQFYIMNSGWWNQIILLYSPADAATQFLYKLTPFILLLKVSLWKVKFWFIFSGEVRVFQRRRFSEGQDRTENDWRCRAPRQTQPWRHHHWTDIGKYWSVSLPCSLLFNSKIPSWWKWIWTFKLN